MAAPVIANDLLLLGQSLRVCPNSLHLGQRGGGGGAFPGRSLKGIDLLASLNGDLLIFHIIRSQQDFPHAILLAYTFTYEDLLQFISITSS